MRIALGIEYEGTHYQGWQNQFPFHPNIENLPITTHQSVLETAISRVADTPITVICAGRTDKGVHATGQVVHFDTEIQRETRAWIAGTNRFLPADMRVSWALAPVAPTFHARFSALKRRYHYFIYNHPIRAALWRNHAYWYYKPLNVESMQTACQYLIGEHDFSSFRAVGCQAQSAWRKVSHLDILRKGALIEIIIEANAFLYHMVRNIVGVLIKIGTGECPPTWAGDVLEKRDRTQAGMTAPAAGLYLTQVTYPPEFKIPQIESILF